MGSVDVLHLIYCERECGVEEEERMGNPGLDEALRERIEAEAGAGGTSGGGGGRFFKYLNFPACLYEGVSGRYSGNAPADDDCSGPSLLVHRFFVLFLPNETERKNQNSRLFQKWRCEESGTCGSCHFLVSL